MKVCSVCAAAFVGDYVFCPRDGTRLDVEDGDRLTGKQVDRFRIEARIGNGRLGRAYHARIGEKEFAVKVLIGDLSADRHIVKQFRQTAHLLSKVRSPRVAEVVEFDTTDSGLAFVASKFVGTQTLADLIRKTAPMSREVADVIVSDLAEGLDAAHQNGLVYRDLRPETVRVDKRRGKWRALIADFSLYGLRSSTAVGPALRYAAPECLEEHVGPASDLYSLGVMLADMVEGGPAAGHPLLPLLLHRLPEGRLQSAKDLLDELKGARRQRAARTDDLELSETPVPASAGASTSTSTPAAAPPVAEVNKEWASHFEASESADIEPPDEPEMIDLDDLDAVERVEDVEDEVVDDAEVVAVVVGRPEQSVPWPQTQQSLAALLVDNNVLTRTEHDALLDEVATSHRRLLQVLFLMRPELADRVTKWLSTHLDLDIWTPGTATIHPRVLATIPQALATELGVVPHALRAEKDGNTLFVAVSDPVEKPTRQAIEAMVNHPVVWALSSPEHVDDALEAAYGKEVRHGVPATMRIRRPNLK